MMPRYSISIDLSLGIISHDWSTESHFQCTAGQQQKLRLHGVI